MPTGALALELRAGAAEGRHVDDPGADLVATFAHRVQRLNRAVPGDEDPGVEHVCATILAPVRLFAEDFVGGLVKQLRNDAGHMPPDPGWREPRYLLHPCLP